MFLALCILGFFVCIVILVSFYIRNEKTIDNVYCLYDFKSYINIKEWRNYIGNTAMEDGSLNSPVAPNKSLFKYVDEIKNLSSDSESAECKIIKTVEKL